MPLRLPHQHGIIDRVSDWPLLGTTTELLTWLDQASLAQKTYFVQRYLTATSEAAQCQREHHHALHMLRTQVHELRDAYQRGYLAGVTDTLDSHD